MTSLGESVTISDKIELSHFRPLQPPRWVIREMLIARMLGPDPVDAALSCLWVFLEP